MMVSVETYLRRRQRQWHQLAQNSRVRSWARWVSCGLAGFLLSGAALAQAPQPIAMGLCCALGGWRSGLAGLCAMAGYRVFWGSDGVAGVIWSALGTVLGVFLGNHPVSRRVPLLIPTLASFGVAATGLGFQLKQWADVAFSVYALQVLVAAASACLFAARVRRGSAPVRWLCSSLLVLSLGCVGGGSVWNPGPVLCGWFLAGKAFPGLILAGMGLDLARLTPFPMTAVLCSACFLRRLPVKQWWMRSLGVVAAYLGWMALWGVWEVRPLPGLMLGSALGEWLSPRPERLLSPGHTGRLQVKLEQMARTLTQTQQLLLETPIHPVDEVSMVEKVRLRACALCSLRGSCREQERLTADHLHRPGEFSCRRTARIRGELGRAREHLAILNRDRKRRQEYHFALVQQYQFLAAYLQSQADSLGCREGSPVVRYRGVVSARSRGKELSNGDSCLAFPGKDGMLFVILCDGMGTGLGAARESQSALAMLRQMLTAEFPAPYALRSLNSLLLLRGLPGGVSVDLAQICLCTGSVVLYKWGAAPSYWVHRQRVERLGCANLPPGLGMAGDGETVLHLSLSRGDTLVLLSDGAAEAVTEDALRKELSPGDLARHLVQSVRSRQDDATAVVIRLLAREA